MFLVSAFSSPSSSLANIMTSEITTVELHVDGGHSSSEPPSSHGTGSPELAAETSHSLETPSSLYAAQSASSLEAGQSANVRRTWWRRRAATHVVSELKTVARLQWLIMTLAALIVLPWTYRSWRLAQWTAGLEYFQYCQANVVTR